MSLSLFDKEPALREATVRVLPADQDAALTYLRRRDALDIAPALGLEVSE